MQPQGHNLHIQVYGWLWILIFYFHIGEAKRAYLLNEMLSDLFQQHAFHGVGITHMKLDHLCALS